MAIIPIRRQRTIHDFSAYNFAANIPLEGERRYFDTVFTGVQNNLSVMGDEITLANALPFLEPIIIHATANVNLNDLRIAGNRVLLWNTTALPITINIGTTGIPDNISLPAYQLLAIYFDGTNWRNAGGDHIHNDEFAGFPYMLDEADCPAAFVLNAGSSLVWANVDFSAYVPTGQYLKGLILYAMLAHTGDGVVDTVYACTRRNGSAEADTFKTRRIRSTWTNLAGGTIMRISNIFPVLCDTSAIIQYLVNDAQASLSLSIVGYLLESRL